MKVRHLKRRTLPWWKWRHLSQYAQRDVRAGKRERKNRRFRPRGIDWRKYVDIEVGTTSVTARYVGTLRMFSTNVKVD